MMLMSLPMYAISPADVEAFADVLRQKLRQLGLASTPDALNWPQDLFSHWQTPDLLLSQTCGFPLMESLPQVQLVGTFSYHAPGCDGFRYRSFLLAREEDAGLHLADFRHRRLAFNSTDSQSGYNSLRALVAPLAKDGRFFSQATATGGHRESLHYVQQNLADLAAIDCVTLELLRRTGSRSLTGLEVIGQTAAVPGLPMITCAQTSSEDLAILRQALHDIVDEPVSKPLLIEKFTEVPRQAYQVISQMKALALALGVSELMPELSKTA
ncbi:phosphate/phosphite/phosphonate ABC transporter substrate-binding protein [Rahnella perminowiae]|uniref:phosphate/phosphite/phosphonate ABC transporter substrate-binding protein n=1 Tax=Rahnella perminowiae TaxID=2816244 RepID=UPI00215B9F7E|nr:PhnD/SsuA/transferrin family substrate-binding protein [Rahnella perminowiae]MCR9000255.1 PhnD/SsuA/transferrin family substrate-binding protein [Rahnella perminowiae]